MHCKVNKKIILTLHQFRAVGDSHQLQSGTRTQGCMEGITGQGARASQVHRCCYRHFKQAHWPRWTFWKHCTWLRTRSTLARLQCLGRQEASSSHADINTPPQRVFLSLFGSPRDLGTLLPTSSDVFALHTYWNYPTSAFITLRLRMKKQIVIRLMTVWYITLIT